jgi:hypothetical protein
MAEDPLFGPDGTQDPPPLPFLPDPVGGLVTGAILEGAQSDSAQFDRMFIDDLLTRVDPVPPVTGPPPTVALPGPRRSTRPRRATQPPRTVTRAAEVVRVPEPARTPAAIAPAISTPRRSTGRPAVIRPSGPAAANRPNRQGRRPGGAAIQPGRRAPALGCLLVFLLFLVVFGTVIVLAILKAPVGPGSGGGGG